jgi:predicted outer membrane repeat protein
MKYSAVIIAIILIFFSVPKLYATTWYIKPDSTGDAITIQAGIDSAAVGDTVLVACGTYYEYNIIMGSGITLKSETGEADCATIDAQRSFANPGPVMVCNGDSTTHIEGIKLKNGYVPHFGGGLYCSGDVIIMNCDFIGNYAEMGGGGAICDNSPSFTNCGFYGNRTDAGGGGVLGGNPVFRSCEFSGNSSANGTGGALSADNITFHYCSFSYNHAHLTGGAIISENVICNNCIFANNYANYYGGAIHGSNIEFDSCSFYENHVDFSYGGAMYIYAGVSQLSNCTFYNNWAPNGSAIYSDEDSTVINNSTFSSNAVYEDGIIYCFNSSLLIQNSIVAFSTNGEAVFCDGACGVELTCCDIYGNSGGDWVGCIGSQYGINGNFSTDPLFCDRNNEDYHVAALSDCLPGNNPCAVLIGSLGLGCEAPVGINCRDIHNPELLLMQNYPNPFNPVTNISFTLPDRMLVTLAVFNLEGKLVRTLLDEELGKGIQQAIWDATNSDGNCVSSGIYFCRLKAGGTTHTKKMVLLK